MNRLFDDALHERLGTWPLAYIPYGGADWGEVVRVADEIGAGDDSAYHAACFHARAGAPLFGAPVDPRVRSSHRQQIAAFERALALGDEPAEPLRIPFGGTTLPGYLIPAVGRAREVRPLIVFSNGYDGSIADLYFASAVRRRGAATTR